MEAFKKSNKKELGILKERKTSIMGEEEEEDEEEKAIYMLRDIDNIS